MKTRIIQDDPGGRPRDERWADPAESATRPNLAARMARWSAHHRKKAIFGWLGFVVVAFAIGTFMFPQKTIVVETSGPGESGRADAILYDDFKQPAGESVLIQSKTLVDTDPEFRAAVQDVIA